MRSTIVGLVLAAAFIAALFAADRLRSPVAEGPSPSIAAGKVGPGFTGISHIGNWTLACAPPVKTAPIPLDLTPKNRRDNVPRQSVLGRCRIILLARLRGDPRRVAVATVFRLIGPGKILTMIVHIPPGPKAGDIVVVRAAGKAFRVPVGGCRPKECVAVGGIPPSAEPTFLSAQTLGFVVPTGKAGKQSAMEVPARALGEAVQAMRRAER